MSYPFLRVKQKTLIIMIIFPCKRLNKWTPRNDIFFLFSGLRFVNWFIWFERGLKSFIQILNNEITSKYWKIYTISFGLFVCLLIALCHIFSFFFFQQNDYLLVSFCCISNAFKCRSVVCCLCIFFKHPNQPYMKQYKISKALERTRILIALIIWKHTQIYPNYNLCLFL